MSDKQSRIMIIDTNQEWMENISAYLKRHHIDVIVETRGDTALKRIQTESPDLVIMEYFLPGIDGKTLARELRPQCARPLVILTEHFDEIDEIIMLEMGVDAYLHKPISDRLLLAHITNLISRYEQIADTHTHTNITPALELDLQQRRARLNDATINLTGCEFELLKYFFEHQGIILTRQEIYRQLLDTQWNGIDRSIDLRISRLRTKIEENPKSPQYIKSIRGVGYMFVNYI